MSERVGAPRAGRPRPHARRAFQVVAEDGDGVAAGPGGLPQLPAQRVPVRVSGGRDRVA